MSQQINLLNKEFRPKRELLNADFMLKTSVGFALILGVYAGIVTQEARKLAIQREEWVQRAQDGQARLMQAVKQAPTPEVNKALLEQIAAEETKAQAREQVLAVLKNGAIGEGGGFSGMLQAFARQSLNGVWLTGISTNGAGDQMRISGRAVAPELIAQYISRLSGEEALHGRTFETFEVAQPKSTRTKDPYQSIEPEYIEFILSAEKPAASTPTTDKNTGKSGQAVKS